MARKFLVPVDFSKNEILNVVVQNLPSNPDSPNEGQIFVDSVNHLFKVFLLSEWRNILTTADVSETASPNKIVRTKANGKIDSSFLEAGTATDADSVDGQHASDLLNRANHTGTQLASTISDFDSQVRSSRLDQMAIPTATINLNNQQISGVRTPQANDEPANKQYVDLIAQGIKNRTSVKTSTSGTVVLSGEQTISGVNVVADDVVLVKDVPGSNGIYIVKTGSWVRHPDYDTAEKLVNAYVFVEQGSLDNTGWICDLDAGDNISSATWVQFTKAGDITASNVGSGSIGVFKQKTGNDLEFKKISSSSSVSVSESNDIITFTVNSTKKFVQVIGDGTVTAFNVAHNLGTEDVIVQCRTNTLPGDVVEPDISVIDQNTVQIGFSLAPLSNSYKVTVIG